MTDRTRIDALLRAVREWEELYRSLYKKSPSMKDREQFFLGMIYARMIDRWNSLEATSA